MPNSHPETERLNPPPSYDESEPAPSYDDPSSIEPREPLYLFILYGLSFVLSVIGLGCAFWGWVIARTAPFDKSSKQDEIDSYERNFLGMMSIYFLVRLAHPSLKFITDRVLVMQQHFMDRHESLFPSQGK